MMEGGDFNAMGMSAMPGKGEGKMSSGEFKNMLETQGTNVYVKGLPLGITNEQLMSIFGAYGTVKSCKVLPSSFPDTCPGLVLFENPAEAQWVIQNLNNNVPQGLTGPITLRPATTASEKANGYGKASWKGKGNEFSPYGGGGKGGGQGGGQGTPDMNTMMDMMKMMMTMMGKGNGNTDTQQSQW
eukprot:gnl/TRDRNA2_/TRDRNA2_175757_c0_seq4.p1 gnl/TRDRNA2_/TRDRNA2_175757_c0~~gnl/TRDRNA2_/TRDRNA2_175757_c0_seq4.p1  ORF type:complete len:185 (+),score=35.58 gnl/TRDRNA2_/TRDRNA2_175757_c0_seq4:120-674(+)